VSVCFSRLATTCLLTIRGCALLLYEPVAQQKPATSPLLLSLSPVPTSEASRIESRDSTWARASRLRGPEGTDGEVHRAWAIGGDVLLCSLWGIFRLLLAGGTTDH
jgi:hypothetical protein